MSVTNLKVCLCLTICLPTYLSIICLSIYHVSSWLFGTEETTTTEASELAEHTGLVCIHFVEPDRFWKLHVLLRPGKVLRLLE